MTLRGEYPKWDSDGPEDEPKPIENELDISKFEVIATPAPGVRLVPVEPCDRNCWPGGFCDCLGRTRADFDEERCAAFKAHGKD